MTGLQQLKRGVYAALIAAALGGLGGQTFGADAPTTAPTVREFDGSTEPSEQRKLPFIAPGVILESPVKDGDPVKAGQLLLRQDDRQEQKLLEALENEANSTLEIDAAKTDLRAKQVILDRKQDLFKKNVASRSELDEAQVNVDLGGIQVKLKEFELKLKHLKAEQQAVKVEQMRLLSPINGIVQKRHLGVGELGVPDPDKPAITVVQNNPLKVVVYLPSDVTAQLRLGEVMKVRHETPQVAEASAASTQPAQDWRDAEVSFMDPVADAASNTQKIELKLANDENREAGRPVRVRSLTAEEKKNRPAKQAKTD